VCIGSVAYSVAGRSAKRSENSWFAEARLRTKRELSTFLANVQVLRLMMRHPDCPASARAVAACTLGYLFSPIQLIPTFIPVIGQLDDIAVLLLGLGLIRRVTPAQVIEECEEELRSRSMRTAADASSTQFQASGESRA
jgi:uncharacterized membrane protein YkvA (DUF1232 family)